MLILWIEPCQPVENPVDNFVQSCGKLGPNMRKTNLSPTLFNIINNLSTGPVDN